MNKTVNNLITLENVYVNYGFFQALENINFKMNDNENWCVLGANGSGKSTLIKLFSNDIYPNTAYPFKKTLFQKENWDIFELKKNIGIITNDLQTTFMNWGTDKTVEDIILSGFESSIGTFKHQNFSNLQLQKLEESIKFFNLSDIKNKKVCELSTGQLRLAIIARAFIHNPQIFILDEPTVGLDFKAKKIFISHLRKLANKKNIILITHDIEEIFPEITHIALIHNKTIFKQGLKKDILTSENLSKIFDIKLNIKKENNTVYIETKH